MLEVKSAEDALERLDEKCSTSTPIQEVRAERMRDLMVSWKEEDAKAGLKASRAEASARWMLP